MIEMKVNSNWDKQIKSAQFNAKQNVSKSAETDEKKGMNKGTKIALATTLAALATAGIYIATKGKAKNIAPNVLEKTLSNGNKVVIKKSALVTKDGLIPARKIIVYDKSGKIIQQKSKAITKSINKATGMEYATIRQGFYKDGKFIGRNEVNRYYSQDGNLILKTNKSINDKGYTVITKQSPVGDFVLVGEKQKLASNALNFDCNPGTSGLAQSQRTNGFVRHCVDTTADDARNVIKLAQEKGYSHRCGELKLEKL